MTSKPEFRPPTLVGKPLENLIREVLLERGSFGTSAALVEAMRDKRPSTVIDEETTIQALERLANAGKVALQGNKIVWVE